MSLHAEKCIQNLYLSSPYDSNDRKTRKEVVSASFLVFRTW